MFDTAIAIGTVIIEAFTLFLVIAWITKAPFISWVVRQSSTILRLLFAGAVVSSFIYQYVFSFEPCVLCWYQRIAIVGIAIILFTADIRKSALLRIQTLILSSAGLAVALFHKYLELFPDSALACGTSGPSCTTLYVFEFGYITIPMMSISILLLSLILSVITNRFPHHSLARE